MEPVGAFTRNADITAIRSVDDGLVVDELPAFFQIRRNERFANRPSAWIVEGLEALPRLDVVRTKGGHLFRGFLEHSSLEYRRPDKTLQTWQWQDLEWVHLDSSRLFSSHDKLAIQLRSGQHVDSSAVQGVVCIRDLEGNRIEHALSNLAFIAPSPVRVC